MTGKGLCYVCDNQDTCPRHLRNKAVIVIGCNNYSNQLYLQIKAQYEQIKAEREAMQNGSRD